MKAGKSRRVLVAVVLLLALHAAAAVHAISRNAVTADEVAHLPAGLSYWETGSFALYHHNPPLVKLLAAIPALALAPVIPGAPEPEATHWEYGWAFMYANAARYQKLYFAARLTVVALSVAAGAVLFVWGRAVFGTAAGLLALALWVLCPNVLAHAGIVTTDLGAAAGFVIAGWTFWRHLRRPSLATALACGAALGLALLVKFTALLLLALWPALAVSLGVLRGLRNARRPDAGPRGRALGAGALRGGLALAAAVLVVNLGYGFEGSGRRLDRFAFTSAALTTSDAARPPRGAPSPRRNRFEGSPLGAIPVPLPAHFVLGFDETRRHTESVYHTYLRGEWRRGGWPEYYLVALLVKVPLGTWLLFLVAGAAAALRADFRADAASELVIGATPALILAAVSLGTDINLGLRYVLPVLPFWFLWIARLGRAFPRRASWRWVVPAALAVNLLSVGRVHPHHLSYFHELAGGPERGERLLLDSNLDWGQDLLALADWLARHRPGEPVALAYFGNVDPAILRAQGRDVPFRLASPTRRSDLALLRAAAGGRLDAWLEQVWDEMRSGRRPLPGALARRPRAALPERAPGPLLLRVPALQREAQQRLGLPSGPEPGLYAVSVNFLHGYPYRVRDGEGNLWFADAGAFTWLRGLEPVGRAGYSIRLFEVSAADAERLRRELGPSARESERASSDTFARP